MRIKVLLLIEAAKTECSLTANKHNDVIVQKNSLAMTELFFTC